MPTIHTPPTGLKRDPGLDGCHAGSTATPSNVSRLFAGRGDLVHPDVGRNCSRRRRRLRGPSGEIAGDHMLSCGWPIAERTVPSRSSQVSCRTPGMSRPYARLPSAEALGPVPSDHAKWLTRCARCLQVEANSKHAWRLATRGTADVHWRCKEDRYSQERSALWVHLRKGSTLTEPLAGEHFVDDGAERPQVGPSVHPALPFACSGDM